MIPNQDLIKVSRKILTEAGLHVHLIEPTIQGLVAYYCDPSRHYHNAEHILHMLRVSTVLDWTSINLKMAVLFHDVYYVVGKPHGLNEAFSADLAMKCSDNCFALGCSAADHISDAIRFTSNFMSHCEEPTVLQQQISDLDLCSLGDTDYHEFVGTQLCIQAEQLCKNPSSLNKKVALSRSASFLSEMLEKRGGQLFYTSEAENIYQALAVTNINLFVQAHGPL